MPPPTPVSLGGRLWGLQACATVVRVLSDYLPRNKLLSYRAVVQETEARTHLTATHYQNHVKVRRAKAALEADPTNAALQVRVHGRHPSPVPPRRRRPVRCCPFRRRQSPSPCLGLPLWNCPAVQMWRLPRCRCAGGAVEQGVPRTHSPTACPFFGLPAPSPPPYTVQAQLAELPDPTTQLPIFYGSGKTCTELFLLDHARFIADQVRANTFRGLRAPPPPTRA